MWGLDFVLCELFVMGNLLFCERYYIVQTNKYKKLSENNAYTEHISVTKAHEKSSHPNSSLPDANHLPNVLPPHLLIKQLHRRDNSHHTNLPGTLISLPHSINMLPNITKKHVTIIIKENYCMFVEFIFVCDIDCIDLSYNCECL